MRWGQISFLRIAQISPYSQTTLYLAANHLCCNVTGIPDVFLHDLAEGSERDFESGECREDLLLPLVVGEVLLPLVCQAQQ